MGAYGRDKEEQGRSYARREQSKTLKLTKGSFSVVDNTSVAAMFTVIQRCIRHRMQSRQTQLCLAHSDC